MKKTHLEICVYFFFVSLVLLLLFYNLTSPVSLLYLYNLFSSSIEKANEYAPILTVCTTAFIGYQTYKVSKKANEINTAETPLIELLEYDNLTEGFSPFEFTDYPSHLATLRVINRSPFLIKKIYIRDISIYTYGLFYFPSNKNNNSNAQSMTINSQLTFNIDLKYSDSNKYNSEFKKLYSLPQQNDDYMERNSTNKIFHIVAEFSITNIYDREFIETIEFTANKTLLNDNITHAYWIENIKIKIKIKIKRPLSDT